MKTTMADQVENYLKSIEDEDKRLEEANDIIFNCINWGSRNYYEAIGMLDHMKILFKEAVDYSIEEEKKELDNI